MAIHQLINALDRQCTAVERVEARPDSTRMELPPLPPPSPLPSLTAPHQLVSVPALDTSIPEKVGSLTGYSTALCAGMLVKRDKR